MAKIIEKEEGLEVPLYHSMGMSGDFELRLNVVRHVQWYRSWFEREEKTNGIHE